MENIIEFDVYAKDGSVSHRVVSVKKLCLGRYCSRDTEAMRKFLDEKRAEGYATHGNAHICKKSRYLLTNEGVIELQGSQKDQSGEVEFVAVIDKGEVLITVGSDHNDFTILTMWTDRLGKIYDSAKGKQMCPAVVAKGAWFYEDVKDHWDMLNLRSYVTVSGRRVPFQDFKLSANVDLEYHFRTNPWLKEDGVVLFGGSSDTLPTVPPDLFPTDFHFEIHDPILNRTISHSYTVQFLNES